MLLSWWRRLAQRRMNVGASRARRNRRPRLGFDTLEERTVPTIDLTGHVFYFGNVSWNEPVVVHGDVQLDVTGDLTFGSKAGITGDSTGGPDNLDIRTIQGGVSFGSFIGNRGLTSLTVDADTSVTLQQGVEINLPGDVRFTAAALTDLSFTAVTPVFKDLSASSSITIGTGARITAANITLATSASTQKLARFDIFDQGLLGILTNANNLAEETPDPNNQNKPTLTFTAATHTISRDLGDWLADGFRPDQTIKVIGSNSNDGDDYTIKTVTSTTITLIDTDELKDETKTNIVVKQALTSLLADDMPLQPVDENGVPVVGAGTFTMGQVSAALVQTVAETGVLAFNSPVEAVNSNTQSTITIGNNALLKATGDITVESAASSHVELDSPSLVLGAVYVSSAANAKTVVNPGATITAGGDVTLNARTTNKMIASAGALAGSMFSPLALAGKALKIPGPQVTFAYGKGRSDSESYISPGATVNGDNVSVGAVNADNFEVSATSRAKPQASLGLALGIAIHDNQSHSNAHVGGTINAAGDVTIDSSATNDSNDTKADAVVKGKNFLTNQVQKVKDQINSTLTAISSKLANLPGLTPPKLNKFDLSAGVSYVSSSNIADATVDSTGVIGAHGDLSVTAEAVDNFRAIAIGQANANAQVSLAGAVSVSNYVNHANATLANKSVVNASGTLTVNAHAEVPIQNDITGDLDSVRSFHLSLPSLDTSSLAAFFESVDSYLINLNLQMNALGQITPYLNSQLGIPDKLATSFVGAGAKAQEGGKFAASGSVDVLSLDNVAVARVGEQAKVNQTASFSAPNQTVTVNGEALVDSIHVGGIPSVLSLFTLATKSEGSSVGGTYGGITYNNSGSSYIDDGALVSAAKDVNVTSSAHTFTVNVMESGGGAEKFGVEGTVAFNDLASHSLAWIEDKAIVAAGNDVNVTASSDVQAIIITGTVMKANDIGVGASVAINKLTGETKAWIGNFEPSALLTAGSVTAGHDVKVDAGSSEELYGVSIAGTLASGSSGGGTPDTLDGDSLGKTTGENAAANVSNTQSKAGIGLSGDVAVNLGTDTVYAYLGDGAVVNATDDVTVKAHRTSFDLAVSGAVAISTSQAAGGAVIAGSFTYNSLTRDIEAFTKNATVIAKDVLVDATTDDELLTFTAGAAGGKQTTLSLAGSANVNLITTTVTADYGPGSKITTTGDVTANANEKFLLISVAGGISVAGKVGIGASADVGIYNTTVKSYVGGTVTAGGDVKVTAAADEELISVAASFAVAMTNGNGLGLVGSASSQNLKPDVEAYVAPSGTVTTDKNLLLDANDNAYVVAVGGGAGLGKQAGFAGSVAVNSVDRTVKAYVGNGAKVTTKATGAAIADPGNTLSGTGLLVDAGATDTFYLIGAGGAFGNKVGIAGSGAIDLMTSDVEAYVDQNAKILAGPSSSQNVQVHAGNTTNSVGVAGAVGGGQKAGIGVAVDVEKLNRTVKAYIAPGAMVTSLGDVSVKADSTENMTDVAAGFGLSPQIGVAGSAGVLVLTNTTKAYVDAGAVVTADGSVVIAANLDENPTAGAGGLAIGTSVAFGASNATVVTEDTTEAYVNGTVTAKGTLSGVTVFTGLDASGNAVTGPVTGLSVLAISSEDIQDYAVGASIATGSVGIAGSVTVNVLDEHTHAYVGATGSVNPSTAGATQTVNIAAYDKTSIQDVAGAVGVGAGAAGVGAGADVNKVTKETQAYVAGSVKSAGNVLMQALADEDVLSVAAAASFGSTAGIAGSAGVSVFNLTTQASVAGTGVVTADGNVVVAADDHTNLDLVAGSGGFSASVGIGASAGVPVITKHTHAFVAGGGQVTALGKLPAVNARTGQFVISYGSYNGSFVKTPTTTATASDNQALTSKRHAADDVQPIVGLAITATNRDDLDVIAVSGAIGGNVAVTLAGAVAVQTDETLAYVGGGAKVNADNTGANASQSVLVAAGNDFFNLGVAGSASGGGAVGVGPAAQVAIVANTTKAYIGASAQVQARNDIKVNSGAAEEILAIGAGLGVGGAVGAAGAVSVLKINETTYGYVDQNAIVKADGNVLVTANDATRTDVIAGAAGLGGSVGVGGSAGVVLITKDTQAYVGTNAAVDAKATGGTVNVFTGDVSGSTFTTGTVKGVAVQAASAENVLTIAAAGAGGFAGGVAGAVSVSTLSSNTKAYIASGAKVNQNTGANAAQSVNVSAVNSTKARAYDGSLAGGVLVGGLAGSVDVGIVRNDTSAYIDQNALVNAVQDVAVHAVVNRDLHSFTASAAGGLVGIAGSVSVYAIGGRLDPTDPDNPNPASSSLTSNDGSGLSTGGYADSQTGQSTLLGQLGGYSSTDSDPGNPNPDNTQLAGTTISSASTSFSAGLPSGAATAAINATPVPSGTSAFIGAGAKVTAGGAVDVTAKDQTSYDAIVGGVAAGIVGVGGSVDVVNVASATQAWIDDNAIVSAGGNVTVTARFKENVTGTAFVGTGGLVGLGAQVVIIGDSSSQSAFIDNGASVTQAGALAVRATEDRTLDGAAVGVAVGLAAANGGVVRVDAGGSTTAFVDAGAQIGQTAGHTVGSLEVLASSTTHATGEAYGVVVGLAAGTGNDSKVTVDPSVQAYIAGAAVTTTGDVTVTANSVVNADAKTFGVSAGVVAVGIMLAKVDVSPTDTAYVDTGANITAGGNLTVQALHNDATGNRARATAEAPSAGFAAGNGAVTDATSAAVVDAHANYGSTLRATQGITIKAKGYNRAEADSSGLAIGALGIGTSDADAIAGGSTTAHLDGNVTGAASLAVTADGTGSAEADADASGGGLVAGNGAVTNAIANPSVRSYAGDGTHALTATVTGDINLSGQATARADSDASGFTVGFVGSGNTFGTGTAAPDVVATVAAGAALNAGNNATVGASSVARGTIQGDASGGGVVSLSDGEATLTVGGQTKTVIKGTVTAGNALTVRAVSDTNVRADGSADSAGLGSNSEGDSTLNLGSSGVPVLTRTDIDGGVLSGLDTTVTALVKALVLDSHAATDADALGADSDATSRLNAYANAETAIRNGATIRGTNSLEVSAKFTQISTTSRADATCDCGGGDTDAEADLTFRPATKVTADAGTTLVTHQLYVESTVPLGAYVDTHADKDAALIDTGDEDENRDYVPSSTIDFNAHVIVLTARAPVLVVDLNGVITTAIGVTVGPTNQTSGPVAGSVVDVNDIHNDGIGSVTFYSGLANLGVLTGSPRFTFKTSFEGVTLANASNKDLKVNNIDVTTDQAPALNIQVFNQAGFNPTIDTDGDCNVDIGNTGNSDIQLNGFIKNPEGSTNIHDTQSDIFATSALQGMETRNLTLSAGGNIGTAASRVNATLVSKLGLATPTVSATAVGNLYLGLDGLLLDTPAGTQFNATVNALTAQTGVVDIRIAKGIKTTRTDTGKVEVVTRDNTTYTGTSTSDTFDPATAVDNTADTINLGFTHNFTAGDVVTYSAGAGSTAIGGLVNGGVYFVKPINATTVQLTRAAVEAIGTADTVFDPSMAVDSALDTIHFATPHGFVSGQKITYKTGGGTAIGGLTADGTYYVRVIDPLTIKLAATKAEAMAVAAPLDPRSAVDTVLDTIHFRHAHNLASGEQVVYHTNGGTAIDPLQNDHTYYAIFVDATTIKLAANLADATANTPVAIDLDGSTATGMTHDVAVEFNFNPSTAVGGDKKTITFSRPHRFTTGAPVVYRNGAGGTDIGGLQDGTTYYVIRISDTAIQLAVKKADAVATTPVVITLNTSGVAGSAHQIVVDNTFNPETGVDNAAHTFDLGQPHGFTTGQAVTYRTGGGQPISGLTDGKTYYVIVVDSRNFKLAATKTDALGNVAIPVDSTSSTGNRHTVADEGIDLDAATATGTSHALRVDAVFSGADVSGNAINLEYVHGYQRGDAVVYHNGGGTGITGLTDGGTYYVIPVNATTIQLAANPTDAQNSVAIGLDGTPAAGNNLNTIGIALDKSVATGTAHRLVGPGAIVVRRDSDNLVFRLPFSNVKTFRKIYDSADSDVPSVYTINAINSYNDVTMNVVDAGDTAVMAGVLTSTKGGVIKNGQGTFVLQQSNVYDGATLINAGTVIVEHDHALGSTVGSTTVFLGATLAFRGNVQYLTTEKVTLNGTGVGGTAGAMENLSGNNRFDGPIFLGSNSTINSLAGLLTLNGDINNMGFTLTVTGAGDTTANGKMFGAGGLTKDGTGTLTLGGTISNAFTGPMWVKDGLVKLNKKPGQIAISGPLTVGDGTGADDSAEVRWVSSSDAFGKQPGDTTTTLPITVFQDGLVNLNNFSNRASTLTMTAGEVRTGTGILTLTGNIFGLAASESAVINGRLHFAPSVDRIFTIADGPVGDDMIVNAVIENGGVYKDGPGTLVFAATNLYTGPTVVRVGTLIADHNGALGATGTGTTVQNGASLALRDNTAYDSPETVTLYGAGVGGNGALVSLGGNNSFSGPVVLATNATIGSSVGGNTLTLNKKVDAVTYTLTVAGPGDTVFAGVLAGNAKLVKNDAGKLTLNGLGSNLFTGLATVNAGRLELGKAGGPALRGNLTVGDGLPAPLSDVVKLLAAGQLLDTSVVTVTSSGLLDLNGFAAPKKLVLTGGSVQGGGAGAALGGDLTITAGNNTFTGPFSLQGTRTVSISAGASLTLDGAISGAGSLTLKGGGTLTLTGSGANTFSGGTKVYNGTLILSKSGGAALPGPVTVGDSVDKLTAVVKLTADNQIGDSATVTVNGSGVLDLNGFNDTIQGLILVGGKVQTGAGTLTLGGNVSATNPGGTVTGNLSLTAGTHAFTVNNKDAVLTLNATVGGAGALTKAGLGALVLGAATSYTGSTTVSAGKLKVLGAGVSNVAVSAGAILTGSGQVGAITVNGGTVGDIGAGTPLATLTATGNVTFTSPSTFAVKLSSSGNDELSVTGTVSLGNCKLSLAPGSVALSAGTQITLIASTGGVTGTFAGLAEGKVFTAAGRTFKITYKGGTGNDVVLTVM